MYPASSISDLSAIDAALKGMELQVHNIKNRLREETRAIPKTKVITLIIMILISFCLYFIYWCRFAGYLTDLNLKYLEFRLYGGYVWIKQFNLSLLLVKDCVRVIVQTLLVIKF